MKTRVYSTGDPQIGTIKARIDENHMIMNFKWANTLEQVCIYKRNVLRDEEIDWEHPYRKYTKEEYISFGGFVDDIDEAGLLEYTVCPMTFEEDEAVIILYPHSENSLKVPTKKIQIRYAIKEKNKLFSQRKIVEMNVFCDTDLKKEMICYTKKKGAIPVNEEDGVQFNFMKDFSAGHNTLPEIEIDRDEHIRIYLAKAVKHRELYWVYKQ